MSEPRDGPSPAAEADGRRHVIVLGGGPAALAAAFALTNEEGWDKRFKVTVYQVGWRLGGKCASGRNEAQHQRCEEHGLHVLLGFYENTFGMIRRCYQELGRDWRPYFPPEDAIVFDEFADDRYRPWVVKFPRTAGEPGDAYFPWAEGEPHERAAWQLGETEAEGSGDAWYYVPLILAWIRRFLTQPLSAVDGQHVPSRAVQPEAGWLARAAADRLRLLRHVAYAGLLEILEAALEMARGLSVAPFQRRHDNQEALLGHLKRFKDQLGRRSRAETDADTAAERVWAQMDFWLTILNGILKDDLTRKGFEAVDGEDFRTWFGRHSVLGRVGHDSPYIRATYGVVFGYSSGDPARPCLAAGTALRGLLRLTFGYRKSVARRMRLGAGDTVIAPLYEALKQRGVRFKFFHRVKRLKVSVDPRSGQKVIEGVELERQATPLAGEDGYDPLVTVKGHKCWPSRPRYELLQEGREGKAVSGERLPAEGSPPAPPASRATEDGGGEPPIARVNLESSSTTWQGVKSVTLRRGQHFHDVVLGISIGALRDEGICSELEAFEDSVGWKWRNMFDHVQTVPTQAFQLWLDASVDELGWGQWDAPNPILTTYGRVVDTVADMSSVIPAEAWPAQDAPRSLFYFCGVLLDEGADPDTLREAFPEDKKREHKKKKLVMGECERFTREHAKHIWPHWPAEGARFRAAYYRANVEPAEQYVLSEKDTIRCRLKSDQSGASNLYLAGDWTWNGMNAGCVEAAVMSGFQAARAICGRPRVILGEPATYAGLDSGDPNPPSPEAAGAEDMPEALVAERGGRQARPRRGRFTEEDAQLSASIGAASVPPGAVHFRGDRMSSPP